MSLPAAQSAARALFTQHLARLRTGCGDAQCRSAHCASNPEGPGARTTADAAKEAALLMRNNTPLSCPADLAAAAATAAAMTQQSTAAATDSIAPAAPTAAASEPAPAAAPAATATAPAATMAAPAASLSASASAPGDASQSKSKNESEGEVEGKSEGKTEAQEEEEHDDDDEDPVAAATALSLDQFDDPCFVTRKHAAALAAAMLPALHWRVPVRYCRTLQFTSQFPDPSSSALSASAVNAAANAAAARLQMRRSRPRTQGQPQSHSRSQSQSRSPSLSRSQSRSRPQTRSRSDSLAAANTGSSDALAPPASASGSSSSSGPSNDLAAMSDALSALSTRPAAARGARAGSGPRAGAGGAAGSGRATNSAELDARALAATLGSSASSIGNNRGSNFRYISVAKARRALTSQQANADNENNNDNADQSQFAAVAAAAAAAASVDPYAPLAVSPRSIAAVFGDLALLGASFTQTRPISVLMRAAGAVLPDIAAAQGAAQAREMHARERLELKQGRLDLKSNRLTFAPQSSSSSSSSSSSLNSQPMTDASATSPAAETGSVSGHNVPIRVNTGCFPTDAQSYAAMLSDSMDPFKYQYGLAPGLGENAWFRQQQIETAMLQQHFALSSNANADARAPAHASADTSARSFTSDGVVGHALVATLARASAPATAAESAIATVALACARLLLRPQCEASEGGLTSELRAACIHTLQSYVSLHNAVANANTLPSITNDDDDDVDDDDNDKAMTDSNTTDTESVNSRLSTTKRSSKESAVDTQSLFTALSVAAIDENPFLAPGDPLCSWSLLFCSRTTIAVAAAAAARAVSTAAHAGAYALPSSPVRSRARRALESRADLGMFEKIVQTVLYRARERQRRRYALVKALLSCENNVSSTDNGINIANNNNISDNSDDTGDNTSPVSTYDRATESEIAAFSTFFSELHTEAVALARSNNNSGNNTNNSEISASAIAAANDKGDSSRNNSLIDTVFAALATVASNDHSANTREDCTASASASATGPDEQYDFSDLSSNSSPCMAASVSDWVTHEVLTFSALFPPLPLTLPRPLLSGFSHATLRLRGHPLDLCSPDKSAQPTPLDVSAVLTPAELRVLTSVACPTVTEKTLEAAQKVENVLAKRITAPVSSPSSSLSSSLSSSSSSSVLTEAPQSLPPFKTSLKSYSVEEQWAIRSKEDSLLFLGHLARHSAHTAAMAMRTFRSLIAGSRNSTANGAGASDGASASASAQDDESQLQLRYNRLRAVVSELLLPSSKGVGAASGASKGPAGETKCVGVELVSSPRSLTVTARAFDAVIEAERLRMLTHRQVAAAHSHFAHSHMHSTRSRSASSPAAHGHSAAVAAHGHGLVHWASTSDSPGIDWVLLDNFYTALLRNTPARLSFEKALNALCTKIRDETKATATVSSIVANASATVRRELAESEEEWELYKLRRQLQAKQAKSDREASDLEARDREQVLARWAEEEKALQSDSVATAKKKGKSIRSSTPLKAISASSSASAPSPASGGGNIFANLLSMLSGRSPSASSSSSSNGSTSSSGSGSSSSSSPSASEVVSERGQERRAVELALILPKLRFNGLTPASTSAGNNSSIPDTEDVPDTETIESNADARSSSSSSSAAAVAAMKDDDDNDDEENASVSTRTRSRSRSKAKGASELSKGASAQSKGDAAQSAQGTESPAAETALSAETDAQSKRRPPRLSKDPLDSAVSAKPDSHPAACFDPLSQLHVRAVLILLAYPALDSPVLSHVAATLHYALLLTLGKIKGVSPLLSGGHLRAAHRWQPPLKQDIVAAEMTANGTGAGTYSSSSSSRSGSGSSRSLSSSSSGSASATLNVNSVGIEAIAPPPILLLATSTTSAGDDNSDSSAASASTSASARASVISMSQPMTDDTETDLASEQTRQQHQEQQEEQEEHEERALQERLNSFEFNTAFKYLNNSDPERSESCVSYARHSAPYPVLTTAATTGALHGFPLTNSSFASHTPTALTTPAATPAAATAAAAASLLADWLRALPPARLNALALPAQQHLAVLTVTGEHARRRWPFADWLDALLTVIEPAQWVAMPLTTPAAGYQRLSWRGMLWSLAAAVGNEPVPKDRAGAAGLVAAAVPAHAPSQVRFFAKNALYNVIYIFLFCIFDLTTFYFFALSYSEL